MPRRFDYALALVSHLKEQGGAFVDVGKAAEASGLPRAYLEKVAQELKRAGWLEARKGPGGGYRLLKSSKNATVEGLMQLYSPTREFCPLLRTTKFKSLSSKP